MVKKTEQKQKKKISVREKKVRENDRKTHFG